MYEKKEREKFGLKKTGTVLHHPRREDDSCRATTTHHEGRNKPRETSAEQRLRVERPPSVRPTGGHGTTDGTTSPTLRAHAKEVLQHPLDEAQSATPQRRCYSGYAQEHEEQDKTQKGSSRRALMLRERGKITRTGENLLQVAAKKSHRVPKGNTRQGQPMRCGSPHQARHQVQDASEARTPEVPTSFRWRDRDVQRLSVTYGTPRELCRLEGCGHQFHSSCILPWFVRCTSVGDGALTCPLCRHEETCPQTVEWVGEHTEEDDDDDWVPDNMWRSVIARVMRNSARRRIRRRLLTSMRTLYDQVVQL